jgi:hypothetical protein
MDCKEKRQGLVEGGDPQARPAQEGDGVASDADFVGNLKGKKRACIPRHLHDLELSCHQNQRRD